MTNWILYYMAVLILVMNLISISLWLRQAGRPKRLLLRLPVMLCLALYFTAIAVLSPKLVMHSPTILPDRLYLWLLWIVFLCFGFSIYLFVFEILSLILEIPARLKSKNCAGKFRRFCAWAVPVAAVLTVAWGYYATGLLQERHLGIESSKVDRPLRIVQISDTHIGLMSSSALLHKLVDRVNALKPDLVLFSGDILNDNPLREEDAAKALAGIKSTYGSFGVFGNHERYAGDEESADFFARSGIRLLKDEIISINGLQLLGVNDPGRASSSRITRPGGIIESLRSRIDPDKLAVLLIHRPLTWRKESLGRGIDLTLAGHTHDGQIFPVHLLVLLAGQPLAGHYEQVKDEHLVVSAGAGYWGVPLRVLARPDIVVVDIKPADGGQ